MKLNTQNYYRIAVGSFFFIQGLVFASWASRIPDIKNTLHMNDAALGGVLLAIPMGQLSAMALSAFLVSKLGSKRMLISAALFYPLALVCLGLANSPWHLSMGLFLFGMAANMTNIAVNTQGVGVEKLYGRSIMATFHGLWSMAGFFGGVISTIMVRGSIAPFTHFCIIFGVALLNLIVMSRFLLPRDMSRQERTMRKETKTKFVMPDRLIILLGIVVFGNLACEGTMFDWSGVYFETVIKPPHDLVRLGYIACMCSMTCGRFVADWLVTKFGMVTILRFSGMITFGGLMLAVALPNLVSATIGFMLVGFGVSSVVPLCYSMAGRSSTLSPGVALTTVSTIGFFGFLMGPPLIGFVAQALNLRWSFAIIACIGLATSIIAPMLDKQVKNQ